MNPTKNNKDEIKTVNRELEATVKDLQLANENYEAQVTLLKEQIQQRENALRQIGADLETANRKAKSLEQLLVSRGDERLKLEGKVEAAIAVLNSLLPSKQEEDFFV